MKYWVELFGRSVEIVVDGETVTVDGRPVEAAIEAAPGSEAVLLAFDGAQFSLTAWKNGAGWVATHAGESVPIRVVTERGRRIEEAVAAGRLGPASGAVIAPMPGLVLRVDVQEGATVEAGQPLLVLEAMKMENQIRSPMNGVVTRVAVTDGQAVEKNALLVEIGEQAS